MAEVIERMAALASRRRRRIVLPESEDERVLRAAARLAGEERLDVTLVGRPEEVRRRAAELGVDLSGAAVVAPADHPRREELADLLHRLRQHKGLTREEADRLVDNRHCFAALLVKAGEADGFVAGAVTPTAEVFRAAITVFGRAPGIRTCSTFVVMIHPGGRWGEGGAMLFADAGLVPQPTDRDLADIALAAARTARDLLGWDPRLAFLSFSTKGSAEHADVHKVRRAAELLRRHHPDIVADGEMQFDAAVVPEVGRRKAPESPVAGRANVLVFPDLDAGNIGLKIAERLGGVHSIGPVFQGLGRPAGDLSRGCGVEEIVHTALVTAAQAEAIENCRAQQ